MKNIIDTDRRTNVIPVSFKDRRKTALSIDEEISHDISHPASKNFPKSELALDPLEEILTEFDDLDINLDLGELEDELLEDESREEFIFHHQKDWDFALEKNDTSSQMADTILKQIKRLKEDSKRLKYYLQELNLD